MGIQTGHRVEQYGLALLGAALLLFSGLVLQALAEPESTPRYVGSQVCKGCHEKQYESFSAYAKKSTSFQSILRLRKKLTYRLQDKEFGL